MCKKIDHFPEDADYEADAAEYLLRKSDMNRSMTLSLCKHAPLKYSISDWPMTVDSGHVFLAKVGKELSCIIFINHTCSKTC